jgi:hypothetical protein
LTRGSPAIIKSPPPPLKKQVIISPGRISDPAHCGVAVGALRRQSRCIMIYTPAPHPPVY